MTEFGATPWGRAWLRTVESTAMTAPNSLLPKARSLARNNAVWALTIETGHIRAEVQAFSVHIGLSEWDAATRAEVERLHAEAMANSAGLGPGDLPDALADALERNGIAFAVPAEDQVVRCSCPARRARCVHVLATLYALVQRIDEYPSLALDLRRPTPAATDDPDWTELSTLDVATFYR